MFIKKLTTKINSITYNMYNRLIATTTFKKVGETSVYRYFIIIRYYYIDYEVRVGLIIMRV